MTTFSKCLVFDIMPQKYGILSNLYISVNVITLILKSISISYLKNGLIDLNTWNHSLVCQKFPQNSL